MGKDQAGGSTLTVTASGIGEFTYCPKQWVLSKSYGKISRQELERRMRDLEKSGQASSPEFDLFRRMLGSVARLDAGTDAHGQLDREVRTGRDAGDMSWIFIGVAVALATLAIYLFVATR